MKSILYVGATLMIGASIYGFVDYKKTSHSKEFTGMYSAEKIKEPVVVTSTTIVEPAVEKKDINNIVKKAVSKNQETAKEEEIISVKPIEDDEMMDATETKEITKSEVNIKTSKESGIEKKINKKRKFSTKLFSRGALDERYTAPKVKEDAIIETRKADKKD